MRHADRDIAVHELGLVHIDELDHLPASVFSLEWRETSWQSP
jgi:hypothetical protein